MMQNIIKIAAGLENNDDVQEYRNRNNDMLANLDKFEVPFKIVNEQTYLNAYRIKSLLSSLSCYTFNTNHPENDRVWALEAVWGSVLKKYNDKALLKNSDDVLLANYILGNKRYQHFDHEQVMACAKSRGFLRIVNGSICVIGLKKKVGNNVFSVDRKGREHRKFCNTIGRQYFMVTVFKTDRFHLDQNFLNGIEPLGEGFHETSFADAKNCARYPALRKMYFHRLIEILAKFKTDTDQSCQAKN